MPFLYFDRGLLINYSLLAAYYSLISFEDTFLPDVDLYDESPFVEMDLRSSQVRINAATLHWYSKYVSYFARLHHRLVTARRARRAWMLMRTSTCVQSNKMGKAGTPNNNRPRPYRRVAGRGPEAGNP